MKIIERYIALHTLWGVLVVLSLFAIVFFMPFSVQTFIPFLELLTRMLRL